MNEIPEEIVRLAESGEVKLKITKPQEVAFAEHKGSWLLSKIRRGVWKISAMDRREWVRDCGSFCNCML